MKIFIVDDDSVIRKGIKKVINRYLPENIVVGEAADGQEALDAIMDKKPDILITDIKMPVLDGVALIRVLKNKGIGIKIIVLSGFEEYSLVRESLKNGAEDYLLKPVDTKVLIELIKKLEQDIENDKKSETDSKFANDAVNQALEMMKGQMLEEIIKGNYDKVESYAEKSREFDLSGEKLFGIIFIDTDYSSAFYKTGDRKFELSKNGSVRKFFALPDLRKNNLSKLYITTQDRKTVLLVSSAQADTKIFTAGIHSLLEEFQRFCREELDITLTCGISTIYDDIRKTHISYFQALFALERRFFCGGNRIILYNPENNSYCLLDETLLEADINELIIGIELGQLTKVKKVMESLLHLTSLSNVDPKNFREVWTRIVNRVGKLVQDFRDISESFRNKDMNTFIYEIDTLKDLKEYLTNTFLEIVEGINRERSEKSKKSIEIAKDYIRKHYKEDINLKLIAEHVCLNATYFSDLFKLETGKNFIDFLIETRINAAKKILSHHESKIYEIAEAVGYSDPTSFNRAFKKCVGVSPVEYRKIIK